MKAEAIILGQKVVFYFDENNGHKYRVQKCEDHVIELLAWSADRNPQKITIQLLPAEHPEGWPYDFDEIIAKFKDGKKRYEESAMFNKVIQMLIRGADHYDIIDQILLAQENTQAVYEQHMKLCKGVPHIVVSPNDQLLALIKKNATDNQKKKNELILILVEMETTGVISFIPWGPLQSIMVRYLIWKIKRKVNRWNKFKKMKEEAHRKYPMTPDECFKPEA